MGTWSSEAIQLNVDTCVDVHADADGVVLGQLGKVWLHNTHLTPDQARTIAHALVEGSIQCELMGGAA